MSIELLLVLHMVSVDIVKRLRAVVQTSFLCIIPSSRIMLFPSRSDVSPSVMPLLILPPLLFLLFMSLGAAILIALRWVLL